MPQPYPQKIKIISYKDVQCTKELHHINAFINPTQYSRSIKVDFNAIKALGSPNQTKVYNGMSESSLTLGKIIVDGTGVVPDAPVIADVETYINDFRRVVVQFNGEIHSTPFLKVIWGGSLSTSKTVSDVFVCSGFDVTYTLFRNDGTPLRAEITLGLTNTIDEATGLKIAAMSSPDLTHARIVKAGDTLPLLCHEIYGDSSYYYEVARKNNLESIHAIKPGMTLHFYPLKKQARQ